MKLWKCFHGFQGHVLDFCGPESLERPVQKKMAWTNSLALWKWFDWNLLNRLSDSHGQSIWRDWNSYISRLKRWNSNFDRFQNHKHVSFSAILLNPSQDHSQSVDCVVWNFLFCQQLHLFQDSLQLSTFWLMHQFLFIVFTYRSSQLDWQVWAKIKSSWAGFVGRDINLHSVQIHRWE